MLSKILLFLLFSTTSFAKPKLVDKVVAIFNDQIITHSDIQRFKKTTKAKRQLSPFSYTEKKYTTNKVIDHIIQAKIIRDKLGEIGYTISDDRVESQINGTQKQRGLTRKDLKQFLKTQGISFAEYFEIVREAIEFNLFNAKIITPLVSVSDQEVKNFYYENAKNKNTLNFRYVLVDFIYDYKKSLNLKKMPQILMDYRISGVIPPEYKDFDTVDMKDVLEEEINKKFAKVLKSAKEGTFSDPVRVGGQVHIFYVQSKNLTESQEYAKVKELIRRNLTAKKTLEVSDSWLERQRPDYFIQINQ